MEIFVINLARNPERLERMQRLLAGQGLSFERLDAVDGKALSDDEISRWSQTQADGSLCLSPSEVGCMLSHRSAWEKIAAMGDGHAVVLEDDIHLSSDAAHFLQSGDWIPADAEIVKIETVRKWKTAVSKKRIGLDHGHALAKLLGQHFGTGGYIITAAGARRLLDEIGPVHMAIDQIMFDPASQLFGTLSIYQVIPALCVQDQFLNLCDPKMAGEVTRAWRANRQRKSLPQKALREAKRLKRQLVSTISGSGLNPFSDKVNIRVAFHPTGDLG